jgi:hypothetical protein
MLCLASGGVYPAITSLLLPVRSYRTFSPLLFIKNEERLFSVALSMDLHPPYLSKLS